MSRSDPVKIELKLSQEGRDSIGELGYFYTTINKIYLNIHLSEESDDYEIFDDIYQLIHGWDDGVYRLILNEFNVDFDLDRFVHGSQNRAEHSDHSIAINYLFSKNPQETGAEGDSSLPAIILKIIKMIGGEDREEELYVYKEEDEENDQLIIRVENEIDLLDANDKLEEIESELND
jgi:hypothetical protein